MAKVKINWPPMSMKAEGEDAAVLAQAEQFLKYVKEAHKISFDVLPTIFRDGCRDPEELDDEDVEPLTEPEEVAPGAQWDVVAIYDNAGIPSIMHRFRRMNDKDLFRGGKDKPHPAFIIGGEVYDEIYISVYQNTMINGKPYSLPYMEPVTDITADKFADACFSKGEGWHCMTAAEWGLLACLSWKNGTLPHGNTRCGKYHADPTECGVNVKDSNKTLTGSGPATWTHDHTPTGVHDLCGNVGEIIRGLRIKDGALCKPCQAARNFIQKNQRPGVDALPGQRDKQSGRSLWPAARENTARHAAGRMAIRRGYADRQSHEPAFRKYLHERVGSIRQARSAHPLLYTVYG